MHRLTQKRSPFPVPWMNAFKQKKYDLKEFDSTFEDPYDISTLKSIFSTFDCHFLVGQQLTSLLAEGSISWGGVASWLSGSNRPNQSLPRDGMSTPRKKQPFCWWWHLWRPHLAINIQQPTKRTRHVGNPLQLVLESANVVYVFFPHKRSAGCGFKR